MAIMSPHEFNDAADRATYSSDMAGQIDSIEDRLLELVELDEEGMAELISRMEEMTPGVRRTVVALAAGVLRKADDAGMVRELFGCAAPVKEDLAEFAEMMKREIKGNNNPALQARCIDFVYRLGLNGGKNQTQIAEQSGVGKAAVSKRCRNLVKRLRLKLPKGMKSETAVRNYEERQKGRQQRPPKEPWPFAGFFTRALSIPNALT